VGVVVAFAAVAAILDSPVADAAFSGRNGALVFENRGTPWMINPDASGRARVRIKPVKSQPYVNALASSPDGKTIAFLDGNGRGADLYITAAYRAAGQRFVRPRLLTRDAGLSDGQSSRISWSRDGREIVFQRDNEIRAIRRDGTGVRRILRLRPTSRRFGEDIYYGSADPAWSPDGRRVVFAGVPAGVGEACPSILTARAGGGDERRVTPPQPLPPDPESVSCPTRESSPAWSPDGSRIAFVRLRESSDGDVWVARANGGGETRIAERKSRRVGWSRVVWSPDGRKIAATLGGGIWVMNPDGSRKRRVMIGNGHVEIATDIDWQRCVARRPCGVPRGSR